MFMFTVCGSFSSAVGICRYSVGRQHGDCSEYVSGDERMILKEIRRSDYIYWISLSQGKDQWLALLNMLLNFGFHKNVANFLIRRGKASL
jgi:hypothetical protein